MLRRDLMRTGMLLTAGGAMALSGIPAAQAAKKTGMVINGVKGTAWPTAGGPTDRFRGRVRITNIQLVDRATRTFKLQGFLSGNVFTDSGRFVRHVPETAFGNVNAVLGPAVRRADAEPGVIPAAFEPAGEIQLAQAVCPILNLDIGAIMLDLLGLVVDLAPISLDITAEAGPGNLLGNLLCALVGLLDGAGPLSGITNLLTQINTLLGSILAILGTIGV